MLEETLAPWQPTNIAISVVLASILRSTAEFNALEVLFESEKFHLREPLIFHLIGWQWSIVSVARIGLAIDKADLRDDLRSFQMLQHFWAARICTWSSRWTCGLWRSGRRTTGETSGAAFERLEHSPFWPPAIASLRSIETLYRQLTRRTATPGVIVAPEGPLPHGSPSLSKHASGILLQSQTCFVPIPHTGTSRCSQLEIRNVCSYSTFSNALLAALMAIFGLGSNRKTLSGLEKYNNNAVSYRYFYITKTNEISLITNEN